MAHVATQTTAPQHTTSPNQNTSNVSTATSTVMPLGTATAQHSKSITTSSKRRILKLTCDSSHPAGTCYHGKQLQQHLTMNTLPSHSHPSLVSDLRLPRPIVPTQATSTQVQTNIKQLVTTPTQHPTSIAADPSLEVQHTGTLAPQIPPGREIGRAHV